MPDRRSRTIPTALAVVVVASAVATMLASAAAQTARLDYRRYCAGCHSIGGGPLSGPDLKDIEARREREWIARFVADPASVYASGDAAAIALVSEHRGLLMPTIPGMTRARALEILAFIAAESALERSEFADVAPITRALTAADVEIGRSLFTGAMGLKNGGPACATCHRVERAGCTGSGILGPDLSDSVDRVGGRKALAALLAAPGWSTMAPLFRDHPIARDEIAPLVAFLESARREEAEELAAIDFAILLIGILALAALVAWAEAAQRRRARQGSGRARTVVAK